MNDGEAILRAILAEPEYDTHRLIYADWCEDNGQSDRAEFIRLQFWLDRFVGMKAASGRFVRWRDLEFSADDRRREQELLCSFQTPPPEYPRPSGVRVEAYYAWAGAVANLPDPDRTGWTFRRGFVAVIRCTLEAWRVYGPAATRTQPIERVRLLDKFPQDMRSLRVFLPYCAAWYRSGDIEDTMDLPPDIWDLLDGHDPEPCGRFKRYYGADEQSADRLAYDALSRACILLAQQHLETT
jgi:uncharacterized protein (TIGR02996 family)